MRTLYIGTLATLLVLVVVPARAEEVTPKAWDPKVAMTESDTNQDGRIEAAEFYERITEVFYHADADKDGTLTVIEYDAAVAVPQPFDKVDANADGKTSLHEFFRERSEKFEAIDVDDDGNLSEAEVVQGFEAKPAASPTKGAAPR